MNTAKGTRAISGNKFVLNKDEMDTLVRRDDSRAARLRPGQFVVPLGGDAQNELENSDQGPLWDDTMEVTSMPHPNGVTKRAKLVAFRVRCMDGTKMYVETDPDHEFAVFTRAS